MSSKKKVAIFCCVSMLAFLCAGCGKKEEVQQSTAIEEVTVEESAEVQQPAEEETVVVEESTEEAIVEEEQVEDSTANLSNEEWVQSLNLQTGTYLIFNDTTGERKVLEDGQEYKMLETDVLAFWWPLDWKLRNERIGISFENKAKYECMLLYLNYEEIQEKTEVIMDVEDANGNEIPFTIYLSK